MNVIREYKGSRHTPTERSTKTEYTITSGRYKGIVYVHLEHQLKTPSGEWGNKKELYYSKDYPDKYEATTLKEFRTLLRKIRHEQVRKTN